MNLDSTVSDLELVKKLSADNKEVFNYLVQLYYRELCRSAKKYVRSEELAEEIVQDVFVSLWQRRHFLFITVSFRAYLHTAVKYQSINCLKKNYAQPIVCSDYPEALHPYSNHTDDLIAAGELQKVITNAVAALPDRCRIIFDLSRNAGLSYKEIAVELDVSVKTVETHMTIAIARLKVYLAKHWGVLAIPLLVCTL